MKSFVRLFVPVGAALAAAGILAGGAFADTNNSNTQSGSNTAASTQSSAAMSGNATAAGTDSQATSGSASSSATSAQIQSIFQQASNQTAVAGGEWPFPAEGDTTNSNAQTATNGAEQAQDTAGVSGNADASDGGVSSTGAASSAVQQIQEQLQEQLGSNQSVLPEPAEEE